MMAKRSTIPFGPQHPVLPEPIHLDLVLEDEVVVEAIPNIGFVHRGLEKLVETRDFKQYVYVAERVCGICSFGHGLGYCQSIEQMMGIDVPRRARFLRTLWMEMSRVHSHLLWLGLLADALGFESLFMQSWRLREKVLDLFDMTTGGRIIFSVNQIGGVLKDMDEEMLSAIKRTMTEMETTNIATLTRAATAIVCLMCLYNTWDWGWWSTQQRKAANMTVMMVENMCAAIAVKLAINIK